MPKFCSVCTSPHREQIDIELVNGSSIRAIAGRFSLSRSSVGRHRQNCHQAIVASTLEGTKAGKLLEAQKKNDDEVHLLAERPRCTASVVRRRSKPSSVAIRRPASRVPERPVVTWN